MSENELNLYNETYYSQFLIDKSKSASGIVRILLFGVIILIAPLYAISAKQPQSNITNNGIQFTDIKNSLVSIQNDTNPSYIKLTDNQIKSALSDLPGWTLLNGKLHKTFVFVDYPTLFGFMFEVAKTSQALNHHPNMTSTFNTLTLDYDTWSLGQSISNMDVRAAGIIEKMYDTGNYTK